MKMKGFALGAGALAVALFLGASAAPADESSTTAEFVRTCHDDPDGCKDVLAEVELDGAACVPSLDQVLAEIGQHPEWSAQPWTTSVDTAINDICIRQ